MSIRTLRRFAMACLAVAASATAAAAGPALDRIRGSGILVAAADPTWPPFSWRDPLGEFHGFDVEVTRAIADRLGARAEFVTPPWEEQTAGGWEGRWDIAVTSMTPTPERAARLAFPAVYAYSFAALAVAAERTDVQTPADAAGLRVGVVEGTIFESFVRGGDAAEDGLAAVRRRIAPAEVVPFADSAAPYRLLAEGRLIDAVLDDVVAIEEQIARGRPIRIVGEPLFAAPVAVAVDQGDPEFVAAIADIVAEMRADGALRDLALRWFETDQRADVAVASD